jgi:hypothetical protein
MTPHTIRDLGIMRPLGGGDPIPLKKTELTIGRRPTCDIRLDFDNISGKHCLLRFVSGVWHVRDLNSTNGTTVNGQKVDHEHGLMPDDQLGVAGRYFMIDYDPVAPTSLKDANQILEDEMSEELGESATRRRSLMELAGLGGGDRDSSFRRTRIKPAQDPAADAAVPAPRPPAPVEDEVAAMAPDMPAVDVSDEDFLDMIREDIQIDGSKKR